MVLYGIATMNNLQEKYYKKGGLFKPITPHIIAENEANINGVYAIQQVSFNVYFVFVFEDSSFFQNLQKHSV
jgi:hypothetical protein